MSITAAFGRSITVPGIQDRPGDDHAGMDVLQARGCSSSNHLANHDNR